MLKPRTAEQETHLQNGWLLVEVQVTMAVKTKGLELADALIEGLLHALQRGDYEELKRLSEAVAPATWRSWMEYDGDPEQ